MEVKSYKGFFTKYFLDLYEPIPVSLSIILYPCRLMKSGITLDKNAYLRHLSVPCISREMTFIAWVMWSGLTLIWALASLGLWPTKNKNEEVLL